MTGRPQRFKQEQVIKALAEARGLKMVAADALHCNRATVNRYIARYPAVREAYEDAIEGTIDLAQSKLIELIEQGEWRAIRFVLGTLGKDRGFTERQEIAAVGEDAEAVRQRFLEEIRKVYGEDEEG